MLHFIRHKRKSADVGPASCRQARFRAGFLSAL